MLLHFVIFWLGGEHPEGMATLLSPLSEAKRSHGVPFTGKSTVSWEDSDWAQMPVLPGAPGFLTSPSQPR